MSDEQSGDTMGTEQEYDRLEARLAEYYSPYERAVWWSSHQVLLGGERAIDVLASGRQHLIDRVLDQLDACAHS